MNQQKQRFIENNLQLTNRLIAMKLNLTEAQIRNYLHHQGITRDTEQREQIRLRNSLNQMGENNPNWKGGISKNNYHYKKIQVERYPKKIKARQKVYYNRKNGNIVPKLCSMCGSLKNLEAHHINYDDPMKIIWLCRICHRKIHNKKWEQDKQRFREPSQNLEQLNLFASNNTVYR